VGCRDALLGDGGVCKGVSPSTLGVAGERVFSEGCLRGCEPCEGLCCEWLENVELVQKGRPGVDGE
jgi:hypothetical protein